MVGSLVGWLVGWVAGCFALAFRKLLGLLALLCSAWLGKSARLSSPIFMGGPGAPPYKFWGRALICVICFSLLGLGTLLLACSCLLVTEKGAAFICFGLA